MFLTVPAKLLLLMLGTLLLVTIAFSTVSLSRLAQESQDFQQQKRQQGQQQLLLHHDVFTAQLRSWLESFAGMHNLAEQQDYQLFVTELAKQLDALQINFSVDGVWLFDQANQPLFATAEASAFIQQTVQQVLVEQSPENTIHCATDCQQLVFVPLLNRHAQLAVIVLSSSLIELMYGLNSALKSEVALVSFAPKLSNSLSSLHILASSNRDLLQTLTTQQQDSRLTQVIHAGVSAELDGQHYFLTLVPLANNIQRSYYLVLMDDVTEFIDAHNRYRWQLIGTILVIFTVLGILSYLVAAHFTKRLLNLSGALPLLAQKQFELFRQSKLTENRLFVDELDILVDSAKELSFELERLNLVVEQKTQELENIAMYDLLTGLPNRNMLNFQLRKAIKNIELTHQHVALLFLDLDDFKKVNDSHGHGEGDELLIEAALRLKRCVRTLDLVSRFGGDEFVIMLEQVTGIDQVAELARAILHCFKQPIAVDASLFYISTSIGITLCDRAEISPNELIRQADIAMYEAKNDGGAQYFIYHAAMYHKVAQRVMIEAEVRQAIAKSQFSLSLQPQIAADNYQLMGFEALLRWHHPERGIVSPDDFIPVLESSAYMIELGYWVIRRCFSLAKQITAQEDLKSIRMAINLSAIQFIDPYLVPFLQSLLAEFQLSASQFELEITEQTLVKDIEYAVEVMLQLKLLGFSFAIDDFGTGYSSLSYLKKLPIDVIKIDKIFVAGMLENHADYQIIMSTISMVKNLGLTVVAEGVETSAQFHCLQQHDCDLIQGYYFSKPLPETQVPEFLANKIEHGYWKQVPALSADFP